MMEATMSGARLAYVVVPIEGTVHRPVHLWKKGKGVTVQNVEEPGGYLVYFPRGHVVRIRTKEDLRRYRLNMIPKIVNLQGLNDPNSPIGRLMMSQDEGGRALAMAELEKQVIRLAEAKSGRIEVTRDSRDLEEAEEAA